MQYSVARAALTGAGMTIGSLVGGSIVGFASGALVFQAQAGHIFSNPNPSHIFFAAVPALASFLAGSAVWGVWMGRLAQSANRKRMALAGALGFAPITLFLVLLLQVL